MLGTLRRETASAARRESRRQALERLQAKQGVVADLIGGRLDLLEATARFRALQGEGDSAQEDGAGWCRTVIGWAYLALGDFPERAEAFCAALQRRLEEHLARFGRVELADF